MSSSTPDIRLASKQTAFSEIPIVDVSTLVDGSDPEGVAKKIGEICEQVGFFYVKNHGVAEDLIKRMYTISERFFDLPFAAKDRLSVANSGPTLRGYHTFRHTAKTLTLNTRATSRSASTSARTRRRSPRSSVRTRCRRSCPSSRLSAPPTTAR